MILDYTTKETGVAKRKAHTYLMISHNQMPVLRPNADCDQYSSSVLLHYCEGIFFASPYGMVQAWVGHFVSSITLP
jgi:hypothetical protein